MVKNCSLGLKRANLSQNPTIWGQKGGNVEPKKGNLGQKGAILGAKICLFGAQRGEFRTKNDGFGAKHGSPQNAHF